MDASSWLKFGIAAAAMALVVFVAASEAGLVSISRARARLMAGQGVPGATLLHGYVRERDSLLRALSLARRLGIVVMAVLAYSALAHERGQSWPLLGLTVLVTLVLIAVFEALPRALVVRQPELWGLRLAPFIGAFKLLFGGAARVLDLPVRAVTRADDPEEEDLLRLMELEENQGSMEEDERQMIRGVFGLDETTVREIMTPRMDIAAVDTESTPADAVKLIIERGFSRIPLYQENADAIAGIVYAKDLFRYLADGAVPASLKDIARPAYFVPESKRVDDLLTEMRRQRTHMAIVVDEYGGTAGLVTIEDMLEEIVGEIEDEHDQGEEPIVRLSDTEALVEGRVSIDDLNELFHASIDATDFDTVGGCVFHHLGRIPTVGDECEADGLRLAVLSVEGHRVKRVRVTVIEKPPPDADDENGGRNGNGEGATSAAN